MEKNLGHISGGAGDSLESNVVATHQRKTKVVVVGAGIAGVTAAAKLIHNGIKDVVVLEAQDYVGGRIQAQTVGGKMLDMGAMFIHGQQGNPVFEIAQRLGAVIEEEGDDEWPDEFYTSDRKKVPIKKVEDLLDFVEEQLDGMQPQVGQTRGEYFTKYFNQFLHKKRISTDSAKKELLAAALCYYSFYDAVNEGVDSLSDVSAWSVSLYKELKGNQTTHIRGGYSSVIKALLNLIPEGVIRTGTPVDHIDWNNTSDAGILVRCENGDVISTDHVIITISMGCLKTVHNSLFSPSLPHHFVTTMTKLECGCIGKIYLKWDNPWWTEDTCLDFLWLESHPVTTLKQDKSKRKTRLGKLWWQYYVGFHTVTEHDDLLLVWLSNHQIEAIKDLDDQEVMAVLHELTQWFVFDIDVPMPNAIYRTNWKDNPFTRGTYTYPDPSFDSQDADNLSLPIFPSKENPRLLLAGEAYTLEYMTTTHGAFITGEQQAENVLKANGITDTMRVVDAICYD